MADVPYILQLTQVAGSGGVVRLSYIVPSSEGLDLYDMLFVSTGIFNIFDIGNSAGQHYTQATQSNPILSSMLQNPTNGNLALRTFHSPLVIAGGMMFYVDVIDTSGAGNTIRGTFNGVRHLPS